MEETLLMEEVRGEGVQNSEGSFIWKAHPHSLEICSLLNPLYLGSLDSFEKLALNRYILARDGFFSLIDFFYRCKNPGGVQTILLIHEKLKFLVPESWADHVLTYNIQLKNESDENKILPKTLYLCVCASEGDVRIKSLREMLGKLKNFYGERISDIDIKIGLFLRESPYHCYSEEKVPLFGVFLREYDEFLGKRYDLLTWGDIEKRVDFFQSCYYYMADECLGHGLSYLDHFFLSRRCTPFDDRFLKRECGEYVYDISCGYDIHINTFQFEPSHLWNDINKMTTQLSAGKSLLRSDFMFYLDDLADEYLLGSKKNISSSSLNFNLNNKLPSGVEEQTAWQ